MEKSKLKGKNNVATDELAVTKTAAWAWYERGSGSDGRSIREFDVWMAKIDPKPSRYKLEAMRNHVQPINPSSTTSSSPKSSKTSRASISLLDKYEIERIYKQLDYYMEVSHAKFHGGGGGDSGGRKAVAVEEPPAEVSCYKSSPKKKLSSKGFWLRNGIICGSSKHDEVKDSIISYDYNYSRRLPPGKADRVVVVVESLGCRPRPGIRA